MKPKIKEKYDFCKQNYPFILAWGMFLGSYGYFIYNQVNEAIEDNAPKDALYKNRNGEWSTLSNSPNKDLEKELLQYLDGNKHHIIIEW